MPKAGCRCNRPECGYVIGVEVVMERDVVCGMQVAPAKAAGTSEVLGKTYYFCSSGCKAKFDADPSRYVASASSSQLAQHTGTSAEYPCPMNPEIRQQG